jgi:hypothetical protein
MARCGTHISFLPSFLPSFFRLVLSFFFLSTLLSFYISFFLYFFLSISLSFIFTLTLTLTISLSLSNLSSTHTLSQTLSNISFSFRFGRKSFKRGVTVANSQHWNWFRFITFDNPQDTKQGFPFENRFQFLSTGIPNGHPFVMISPVMKSTNTHLILFKFIRIDCLIFF